MAATIWSTLRRSVPAIATGLFSGFVRSSASDRFGTVPSRAVASPSFRDIAGAAIR